MNHSNIDTQYLSLVFVKMAASGGLSLKDGDFLCKGERIL